MKCPQKLDIKLLGAFHLLFLPDLLFLQISNRRNTHHQNCSQHNGKTTVYKYVAYSQRVGYKACDKQTDDRREQTYTVEKREYTSQINRFELRLQ